MEWLSIKKHGIPEGEVLAGNFAPRTYGYKEKLIGRVHDYDGDTVCSDDYQELSGVTHFIYINQYDPK